MSYVFLILDRLFFFYSLLILGRVFLSWFPPRYAYSRGGQFLSFYTDPYLNVFRGVIRPVGMVDLSPMIAIFVLGFIKRVVFLLLSFF